jgi:hypothetical protein
VVVQDEKPSGEADPASGSASGSTKDREGSAVAESIRPSPAARSPAALAVEPATSPARSEITPGRYLAVPGWANRRSTAKYYGSARISVLADSRAPLASMQNLDASVENSL